ncbi:MAG: Crp/Fnr family transcriptional regulator [Synergistales bacterium]|nr:Crp/Fnr family transcriptional regulator [Synergistales bacterium]
MIDPKQQQKLYDLYPILSEVDPELLTQSLSRATLLTLKAGSPVFEELQPCNAFPFVLTGIIRVYKQSVNGRELSLYNVTPGGTCVVTAGCLLGDELYNACGSVKEDCDLVMMSSRDFENLLTSRVFREFIFSLFSKRILELMQLVEEVAFEKLDKRLASLLLRQGRDIRISHQELADELGTVREMITRLLNSFSESGLIALSRGRVKILYEPGLQALIER